MRHLLLLFIVLYTIVNSACTKEQLEIDVATQASEFFEFTHETPFGFTSTHVVEIRGNEVTLYTVTDKGCIRLTGAGEVIAIPELAERKGSTLLVTLETGKQIVIEIKGDGADIQGIGFAKRLLFVNEC